MQDMPIKLDIRLPNVPTIFRETMQSRPEQARPTACTYVLVAAHDDLFTYPDFDAGEQASA